jgi:hypothetical protein
VTEPRTVPIEVAVSRVAAASGKQILLDASYVGVEVPIPSCRHLPIRPHLQELAHLLPGADVYQDDVGTWHIERPSVKRMAIDLERRAASPTQPERVAVAYLIGRLDAGDLSDRTEAETALVAMGMVAIHGIRPVMRHATGERKARLESVVHRLWVTTR